MEQHSVIKEKAIRAIIGLGSNLADPLKQLQSAIIHMSCLPKTQICSISNFHWNSFIGGHDEPDCLNAVAKIETTLSPFELLLVLQEIERKHCRQRKSTHQTYSGRTLDLDILLYGTMIIESLSLQIPHPKMKERGFTLIPLAEIEPFLVLPCGSKVADLAKNISWSSRIETSDINTFITTSNLKIRLPAPAYNEQ